MQEELIAALKGAASAGVRVVVLAGAGEAFCAGLDLSALQGMAGQSAEEYRVDAERIERMFRALWECDLPTLAVVQGAAVAGGTGLATISLWLLLRRSSAIPRLGLDLCPRW
jgi:methylglutaconyl-CoA hydratase